MYVKSRFYGLLFVLGILALVLVGCGGAPAAAPAPEAGGEAEAGAEAAPAGTGQLERKDILVIPLNVNIPAPDIWNPYIPGTYILQGMNQNLMEPLFMLNYATGEIDGWLAESFEANDALDEWTVTLREGTEWSDGTPLTSEDVVFTIEMLKEYAPQLNWSGAVEEWVESVEAVDDRTIKFTLTGTNPRFVLENLAGTTSQAIVPLPKHVWEGQDPVTFRNEFNAETGAPVFSGPYPVERFSSTEWVYNRNDDWWGAKTGAFKLPAPLQIQRPWVGNAETHNQMAVNNEADYVGPSTPSIAQSLLARNPNLVQYNDAPPYAWMGVCPRMLSVNNTVEPWDKKEMRWALSYAINRQQIVDVVNEGSGATANFIFPAYEAMQPYQDAIADIVEPISEFNPDKSRELIEGQGYTLEEGSGKYVGPDGEILTLDVVAPPFMEPWGRLVVQQLNEAGIDAVLRILEWGIFRDQTGRGQFEAAVDWDGCGSVVEPWFGMQRFHKKWANPVGTPGTEYVDNTNNAVRWVNDEYSDLIDQMGILPVDDPAVIDLTVQAVEIWADELPDIPLVQTPVLMLFNTAYWTNWPTADNLSLIHI